MSRTRKAPVAISLATSGATRFQAASIVVDPGLQDGVWTTVGDPTVYSVYDNGKFVGHVFAGPIPGSSNDAQVMFDGGTGEVRVQAGWARFRGPYWPFARTPRIVSAPRSDTIVIETVAIEGIDSSRPDVYARITAADTNGDSIVDVPPMTVQADPAGGPTRSLTDADEYVQLTTPVGSPPQLSAVLRMRDLSPTDALRVGYESILGIIKDLQNQIGP